MFSRVPIYKSHWFLIGLVFAFFLLVSPVMATQYWSDAPRFADSPAGTYHCGDGTNAMWVYNYGTNPTVTQGSVNLVNPYMYRGDCSGGVLVSLQGVDSGYTAYTGTSGYENKYLFLVDLTNHDNVYLAYVSTTKPGWINETKNWAYTPTAAFTVDPASGSSYPPVNVTLTDTSTQNPTSFTWNIQGDPTTYTTKNLSYVFTSSGTYTIQHSATNINGTASTSQDYSVKFYSSPVAGFSCAPTNTTSPAVVTCTDSSTNDPTEWLWQLTSYGVSMSPGGSYGAGIYSAVNNTQNPVFNMDGSGMVDVRLTATNPGGSSQEYKANYITISGIAPTPTPTPNIPWPNQTGVCWRSAISLGSQEIREFYVHYQLTDPQGDTYSGQYYPGELNLISGQPFFTAVTGVYIYNEYSMVDNSLLWRQSYVVEDCTITPTPTGTQVFPTPSVTYTVPPTYPTVVIPTVPYTVPTTSVPYPTMTQPSVIQTYPTLSLDFNSSELYNYTITVSPISKPIVSWLRTWIDGYLKTALSSFLALTASPFTYIVSGIPQSTTQLVSGLISFAAYPFAILYAIGVFVRNMPEKVRIVFALLLWSNIVFYYFDFFKRGAR